MEDEQVKNLLFQTQEKLFILGSDLVATKGEETPRITREDVRWIEGVIDGVASELKPIDRFIVLGASLASAYLRVCRTVSKRMERRIQALSMKEPINEWAYVFSNRLSSLFFGLSLLVNQKLGVEETKWIYKR